MLSSEESFNLLLEGISKEKSNIDALSKEISEITMILEELDKKSKFLSINIIEDKTEVIF